MPPRIVPRTADRFDRQASGMRSASGPRSGITRTEDIRDEMPTLVDDDELESARRASELPSSPVVPKDRASDLDIQVEWSDEEPPTLMAKYERILGEFTRVPFLRVTRKELPTLSMDNRMGFILSLCDGASNIETILDVAVMPQREVLHALQTLRDLGIIGFRDADF